MTNMPIGVRNYWDVEVCKKLLVFIWGEKAKGKSQRVSMCINGNERSSQVRWVAKTMLLHVLQNI
jgi:hypothetical protein